MWAARKSNAHIPSASTLSSKQTGLDWTTSLQNEHKILKQMNKPTKLGNKDETMLL